MHPFTNNCCEQRLLHQALSKESDKISAHTCSKHVKSHWEQQLHSHAFQKLGHFAFKWASGSCAMLLFTTNVPTCCFESLGYGFFFVVCRAHVAHQHHSLQFFGIRDCVGMSGHLCFLGLLQRRVGFGCDNQAGPHVEKRAAQPMCDLPALVTLLRHSPLPACKPATEYCEEAGSIQDRRRAASWTRTVAGVLKANSSAETASYFTCSKSASPPAPVRRLCERGSALPPATHFSMSKKQRSRDRA